MQSNRTSDEQHHIEIVRGSRGGAYTPRERSATYVAVCSCGWEGRSWSNSRDAQQDGDEHVLGVAGS